MLRFKISDQGPVAGKPPYLLAPRGELKEDRSDLRQQGQNQRYSIEVVLVVALVKTKPTLASFVRDPSVCVLLAPSSSIALAAS